MTRREHPAGWPSLGYRFETIKTRQRIDGLLSCQAYDLILGRHVTLRLLPAASMQHERELLEREAEALTLIGSHPNVVTLLDRATIGGIEVLVLEPGAPLTTRGQQPYSAQSAVSIAVQLTSALETAHGAGLLHGAVEPARISLGTAAAPLLGGFGTRLADGSSVVLHEASAHTAPELLLGERVSEATDVYGLGSTLYELLVGHAAYRSYGGESVAALSLRILTGPVPPLGRGDVPLALADIVTWAMALEPLQRPPSASWLAEELGRIERSQGWPHTPIQVGARRQSTLAAPRTVGARHRAS
jgi:serine/threonine protein kinase